MTNARDGAKDQLLNVLANTLMNGIRQGLLMLVRVGESVPPHGYMVYSRTDRWIGTSMLHDCLNAWACTPAGNKDSIG